MKTTRASLLIVLGVAALAGCTRGSLVVDTVDSVDPLTVDHLNVRATIGTTTRSLTVPLASKTIPPSHSFGIQIADGFSGTLSVHLDAIDPDGNVVGSLDGSVTLGGSGKIPLALTFGGGSEVDGGNDGGVDGGVDMSEGPDMTPCQVVSVDCAGSTIVSTCSDGSSTSAGCALGCSTTPTAHCEEVYPTAPVQQSDIYATDISPTPTTFPANATVILDALSGDITVAGSTTTVRAA
ncbi:MAG TPA: hypothetical protein VGH63_15165, partial [Polyangia bacterium]